MNLAIVVSKFNKEVTSGLLRGAKQYLEEHDVYVRDTDIYEAPGAFEIPLIAQSLARSGHFDGVICLGCVIKGETAHFEFISLGATTGIMQAMLKSKVPISFGVLTTYNDDQALKRSLPDAHNKGKEAAAACFETLQVLDRIRELD